MPKFVTFLLFFTGVERLKITLQYVGCKQSLGGVVPENSCGICKCRDKGDVRIKKDLSIHAGPEVIKPFSCSTQLSMHLSRAKIIIHLNLKLFICVGILQV